MQQADIQKFVNKFLNIGEDKFYKFLINYAVEKLANEDGHKTNPSIELLSYYDIFLKQYRREAESVYLDIAKQFRRAAHKVYRIMGKRGVNGGKNAKFLSLVE